MLKLLRRAGFWLRARRHADDLASELEHHRTAMQAALEARGLAPADAAAAARRQMGNVALAREDARDVWIAPLLDALRRETVYGLRGLRREPGFALVAILTLSLGVATTTTVFSVADSELWKPLPLPGADRLVMISSVGPGPNPSYDYVSGADVLDWRAATQDFEGIGAMGRTARRVMQGETSESVLVTPVTANFFPALGWPVVAGRLPDRGDEPGGLAAVVSKRGWRRLFNSDPAVVGRTVTLDAQPITILGVIETIDGLASNADFFVALDPASAEFRDRGARGITNVIGRLRPEIDPAAAQGSLQAIASRIAAEYPDGRTDHTIRLTTLASYFAPFNKRPLYFFLGASAVVLLLSCANVANLLLTRALGRRREFAIRGALGGGMAALVRQLIVEGAVLAVPACVAGVLLTSWALALLRTRFPTDYVQRGTQIPLDGRVALFAIAVTAATAIVFGLVPVLFARRVDLNVTLGDGGRTAGHAPGQKRLREALLTAQVAMTLILLAGAGLFLRSYVLLTRVPLGFETGRRVVVNLAVSGPRYAADSQVVAYAEDAAARIRAVPGVADVAIASSAPLESGPLIRFVVADRPRPQAGEEARGLLRSMEPDYFRVLGIPILRGRAFTAADAAGAPRVAIVNETLARTFFPGEDPIGRTLEITPRTRAAWADRPGRLTIVGVIPSIKQVDVHEVDFSEVSVPFAQTPSPSMTLIARSGIDPRVLVSAVRLSAAGADPSMPVRRVLPLEDLVSTSLRGARFNLLLISSFASVALLMACVGIYGSMSRTIGERRREFGLRIALGASTRAILSSALAQACRTAVMGAAAGLFGVYAIARLLGNALFLVRGQHSGVLYGVGMTDPLAVGTAAGVLVAVAIAAAAVPARQAARVDPLIALRAD